MGNHPNRGQTPTDASNPPPDLIRDTRLAAKLSQREAAELVLATTRAWQAWEADPGSVDHRRMPPGTWLLFRARLAAREGNHAALLSMLELKE